MTRPTTPSRRAFSLLEAMVAVALMVALSGGVFTFLFNLWGQRDGLESATDGLRGASALLENMEADVVGAIAADGGGNAGIVGTETSLRLLTRAVAPPVIAQGLEVVVGDLQGVEYRFDERAHTLSASRWDAVRSQQGSDQSQLATGVSRVRLRYFDGSTWRGSFDSGQQGGLPVAIEVAIWFGTIEPDPDNALPASAGLDSGFEPLPGEDELPPVDDTGADDQGLDEELPPPDRVRTIIIPDGPVSSWRDSP